MKMNFREWAAILDAMTDQLRSVTDSMTWWKDEDGNIRDGYETSVKEAQKQIELLTGIIKKIENATL